MNETFHTMLEVDGKKFSLFYYENENGKEREIVIYRRDAIELFDIEGAIVRDYKYATRQEVIAYIRATMSYLWNK